MSGGSDAPAGVDVAADVVALPYAPKRSVLAFVTQRLAVHHEQPRVALLGRLQILLDDDVAVARERIDHLVEVLACRRIDQEHARSAGALQGLDDRASALFLHELLDLIAVTRDERARPDFFGEELEVHLVHGLGQAVRVVEHDNAVAHGETTEIDAGTASPTDA